MFKRHSVLVLFCFVETGSLGSAGCPGTHHVDQAGLELTEIHLSASQVLGLKGIHHTWLLYISSSV